MKQIMLNGMRYLAEGAVPSKGLYPYTCSAFVQTSKGIFPVRTQAKLYAIAMILRGEHHAPKI